VYVDLEGELAARPSPEEGRHPLPPLDRLTAAARRWGIRDDSLVVAYDDLGGQSAARAWWLLRHAGLADVRLLDGGLAAWTAEGLPLEQGEATPPPGDVELAYGRMPVVDLAGAAALPVSGALLDARAAPRYRGEVEPIDPIAGHIPGALSAPAGEQLDADGRFLPASVLRERFAALGVRPGGPVAAYCGSGVTAAHLVAALEVAGIESALYPGSWSQWSNRPGVPVATGAEPGLTPS
jgi:thiosulfate/3-mercaptopyruvate sulfurtransferase